jgi:hypothetical protein
MTLSSFKRAKNSILQEIDNFKSKIELNDGEKAIISASHRKMRSILKNSDEINVIETFLTGSYVRQTMIKPRNDVDFFVQIHYGNHKNDNPLQLFQKLVKVLRRAYPETPIRIVRPCVIVKFRYCSFEIVPAIGTTGNTEKFKIPANKGNGWQYTHPKIPDKWMTNENKKAGGLFKPTIKMLKRWRDIRRVPLKSFHLEMLVRMAFEKYKIEDYTEGIWAFFKNTKDLFTIHNNIPFIEEPGNIGGYVDQYLYTNSSKLMLVKRNINRYYKCVERAMNHMYIGNIGMSKDFWRSIFGSSFSAPSYSLGFPPPSFPPRLRSPFR